MNIEHDEVVGLDVSDEALELAAGGAQGGGTGAEVFQTVHPASGWRNAPWC